MGINVGLLAKFVLSNIYWQSQFHIRSLVQFDAPGLVLIILHVIQTNHTSPTPV